LVHGVDVVGTCVRAVFIDIFILFVFLVLFVYRTDLGQLRPQRRRKVVHRRVFDSPTPKVEPKFVYRFVFLLVNRAAAHPSTVRGWWRWRGLRRTSARANVLRRWR
jgi:hypothetical protein